MLDVGLGEDLAAGGLLSGDLTAVDQGPTQPSKPVDDAFGALIAALSDAGSVDARASNASAGDAEAPAAEAPAGPQGRRRRAGPDSSQESSVVWPLVLEQSRPTADPIPATGVAATAHPAARVPADADIILTAPGSGDPRPLFIQGRAAIPSVDTPAPLHAGPAVSPVSALPAGAMGELPALEAAASQTDAAGVSPAPVRDRAREGQAPPSTWPVAGDRVAASRTPDRSTDTAGRPVTTRNAVQHPDGHDLGPAPAAQPAVGHQLARAIATRGVYQDDFTRPAQGIVPRVEASVPSAPVRRGLAARDRAGLDEPGGAQSSPTVSASDLLWQPWRSPHLREPLFDGIQPGTVQEPPAVPGGVRAGEAATLTVQSPADRAAHPGWLSMPPAAAAGGPGRDVVMPEPVIRQMVEAIRLQWGRGVGEARIRLNPSEFGDLSVSVRVEAGAVVARVTSDTPAVREWLDANQHVLRQALVGHDLRLDKLETAALPGSTREASDQSCRDDQAPDESWKRSSKRRARGATFDVIV